MELEKAYLLKLRKILLHSYPFYIFLFIGLLITAIRLFLIPTQSAFSLEQKEVTGILHSYQIDSDVLSMKVKYQKEYVLAYYYFHHLKEKEDFLQNISCGDTILLSGKLSRPSEARNENGFSYAAYLKGEKTYYLMHAEEIQIVSKKKSLYYQIQNFLDFRMKKARKSYPYLQTFILGNDQYLSKSIKTSFRNNGISHLFAISGMHVSLISFVLLFLLQKAGLKEKKRFFFVMLFLGFYLLFTFSPSVLRATLFFLLFSLNQIYYFYIKPIHLLILSFTICIFIHPYFIYMIGFQYSFSISASLIICSSYINKGGYFKKLLKTSIISFITSSIISLFHFYEINFFSIFYNLFYVPFVSFLIFPFSFLTFFFPFLDDIFSFFLFILEKSSLFFSSITLPRVIVGKPSFFLFLFYLLTLCFYLYQTAHYTKFYGWYFLVPFIFSIFSFSNDSYLYMFDIGQGDSILIYSKGEVMLIDTGGVPSFQKQGFPFREKTSLAEQVIIPYLKSKGIRKIHKLLLTHGDFDHLGEARYLIENFSVDEIYINSNSLNQLETELVQKYSVQKVEKDMTFQIGDFSFYSLNGDLGDENDSSTVLLGEIFDQKLLLMGDASCKSEEKIIAEYHLSKVDILKVGHHGSKTSSCSFFLDEIKPDVALISAGRDNKFFHPHTVVLERFRERKIKYFVTSKTGSIQITFPSGVVKTRFPL